MSKVNDIQRLTKYKDGRMEFDLDGSYCCFDDVEQIIKELEQQITELKESQKQKQIIKLCERLDEAKQQNERMLEALIMIYKTWHEDSILISSTKPIIESVTGKPIEEATK